MSLTDVTAALKVLGEKHGASVPLAEVEDAMAKLFMGGPNGSRVSAQPGARASPAGGADVMCSAVTKGKDAKQCSRKASQNHEGKPYCTTHYNAAAGVVKAPAKAKAAAAAEGGSVEKAKPAAAALDAAVKSSGNTCAHHISGKNARNCTAAGKCQAPDGQWYCASHVKQHQGAASKKTSAGSDAKAATLLEATVSKSQPRMDYDHGLAVDQNGICFINDEEAGPTAVARLDKGVVIEMEASDLEICAREDIPVAEAGLRKKIVGMKASERMEYIKLPTVVA